MKNNTVTIAQIRRAVKAEIRKALSERRRIHRRRQPPRTMSPEQEAKFAARRAKRRAWWKQRNKFDRAQQKAFRALMRAATTYLELIAKAPAAGSVRVNPL